MMMSVDEDVHTLGKAFFSRLHILLCSVCRMHTLLINTILRCSITNLKKLNRPQKSAIKTSHSSSERRLGVRIKKNHNVIKYTRA